MFVARVKVRQLYIGHYLGNSNGRIIWFNEQCCNVVSVCPSNEYLQNIRRFPPHECKKVATGELKHHVFIYRLHNKWQLLYQAYCSGSIISEDRVLTSTHCFLTNRKRVKRSFNEIRIVGGIVHTLVQQQLSHDIQQWRSIKHLYTQKFYRFPAYNLAIAKVDKPWIFNQYVNKIPYTKWNQDFDGVCMGIGLKATTSFARSKQLHTISLTLIKSRSCEHILLRSCLQYYCTKYETLKLTSTEAEGAGLICRGTDDPSEDEELGVLVAVTSLINIGLPSLHNRVGVYHKWVTDSQPQANLSPSVLIYVETRVKKELAPYRCPLTTPTRIPLPGCSFGSVVSKHTKGPPESP